jgi:AcrR family transcriptional regulator
MMIMQYADDQLVQQTRPKVDGRNLRAENTRRKIISATRALINETHQPPKVADIAQRAGVSVRSIFQHYQDVESLFLAVYDEVSRSVDAELSGIESSQPLMARVEALTEQRARAHEAIMPTRRAAARFEGDSLGAAERARLGREAGRQQIEAAFRPELDGLPHAVRNDVVVALQAATDWESWINMRQNYGLSADDARSVWRRMVRAILADAATPL